MGYPMNFRRFVERNSPSFHQVVKDDLQRLQTDSLDPLHVQAYAERAGITPSQAQTVLETFFHEYLPIGSQLHGNGQYMGVLCGKGGEVIATHPVAMPPGTMLVKAVEAEPDH